MSSATDIDHVDDDHESSDCRGRTVSHSSLLAGIILIVMFLGLFVLEFSQILSIAGNVHHIVPGKIQQAGKAPETP